MAKRVQVVLNEDIKSLGKDGDLVEVAPGFAKKEKLKVKDESIKDTLVDMANYALIALILYEEDKKENPEITTQHP